MGIISKTSDEVVKQPKTFPKLMVNSKGRVVLFTSSRSGTIVKTSGGADHVIGVVIEEGFEPSLYTDYEGTVTLSNE